MLNALLILGLFTLIVVVVEVFYRLHILPPFLTRKLGHISGAILCIWMINFLSFNYFIFVGVMITLVNIISHHFKVLHSVEIVDKTSTGTVLFALSVLVLGIVFYKTPIIYQASIAVMGFADSSAALVGKYLGRLKLFAFSQKTLEGSLAFFTVAFAVFVIVSLRKDIPLDFFNLLSMLAVAFTLAFIELFSKGGRDNLYVPMVTAIFLSQYLV